jgi:LytS/YehU family sensor histidine kinase
MLRISSKELVEFKVYGETEGLMIAPMLFIPFVENAFKHGSKQTEGKGILISIHIENDSIILKVKNQKASLEAQKDLESGIGLHNVRKRLKLQYPDKHKLTIKENSGSYSIQLEIFNQ